MPPGATGSQVNNQDSPDNKGSPASRASKVSLAEIISRASPASLDKATNKLAGAIVRRAHPVVDRTGDPSAGRAAAPGPAATVRSIASGMAAIPEAIGRKVARRN